MHAAVPAISRASAKLESAQPHEATEVHTRLLRLALGVEESRAYWEHVDSAVPLSDRAVPAFETRWFGGKSLERVRYLIASCADRYDAFPSALKVLRGWHAMDFPTRQVICHWHLQLSDPLYRDFTGQHLIGRRELPEAKIDRNGALRWLKSAYPTRWSEATLVQFASKLLSATSEAGLVSAKRDPRILTFPKVPDLALAYLMYLLRETRFAGTMLENPYVASVGLVDDALDARLRRLPGLSLRRMGNLTEFEWGSPDLASWARETLGAPS